jgi:hypothetical protein
MQMSGTAYSPSFHEIVDAVEALSIEDQSLLLDIINKRISERRRRELIDQVEAARRAFKQGEVERGTAEDLLRDLED